jgi:hypothetical protein
MTGLRNEFGATIEHHENVISDEFSKVNKKMDIVEIRATQDHEEISRQKALIYDLMAVNRRQEAELASKVDRVRMEQVDIVGRGQLQGVDVSSMASDISTMKDWIEEMRRAHKEETVRR